MAFSISACCSAVKEGALALSHLITHLFRGLCTALEPWTFAAAPFTTPRTMKNQKQMHKKCSRHCLWAGM